MVLSFLTASRIRLISLIITAASISSCNFILVKHFELKEVQHEDKETQVYYLNSWGIDTFNMLNLDSSAFSKLANDTNYKIDNIGFEGMSVPQFRVYDLNGNLICGWAQCFGSLKKTEVLASKELKVHWALNEKLNLKKEEEILGEDIFKKDKKIYIIAYWGGYLGKFSERMLIALNEYQNKYYRKGEVVFVKVNIGDNGSYIKEGE
jgi:hypothetical protein